MTVKSKLEEVAPVSPISPQPGRSLLTRTLSRRELTGLVNWGFRLFVLLLAVYLLGQGSKWISAFVFGCGFVAVGIGVYLTFRVLNFPDLTIEGSYTLGAAVAANLIADAGNTNAWFNNPWGATVVATLCGGLGGFATGFLHTRLKINGLLSSILVTTGLYSINLHVLAPRAIISINDKPNITESFVDLYTNLFHPTRLDGIAKEWLRLGFFAVVALVLILFFNWFLNTQLGLALRATGDNENMIRALGVNTDRAKLTVLVISNALFGLAGGLLAQYLQTADGQIGQGLIVIGLAAVILGESFIAPRTVLMALLGTLVGSIMYRILFTGVYGLELSWGLLLRIVLTLGIAAGLAGLIYLTLNSQTPGYITLLCVVLGGVIGAVLFSWLNASVLTGLSPEVNTALIFKAEQYDIRLVLSVLIVIAMAVPALRKRVGLRNLRVR